MSRVDMNLQVTLLKEAKAYFDEMKVVEATDLEKQTGGVVLTEEHIQEWLEVFHDDKIVMNTCNEARVKR